LKSAYTKTALTVLGVFIAFILIKTVVKSVLRAPRESESVGMAEKTWERLQADATKKHPDIPRSEAIQRESSARATEKLTSETDDLKRTNAAADMFWGFFFINTRARHQFCQEQGVDLQPFVQVFEHAHKNEITKARSIYARASMNEEKLYSLIKSEARQMVVQDMNDIAASNKFSIKEGCQMLSDNANAFVQEMHISKVHPMVFKALTLAK
jgi:hypothetical protein